MTDDDRFLTQRDVAGLVTSELRAAGFDQAEEIGHGGFGVVYRCIQTALDRTVAVKVLPSGLDDENRERFLREQRAMGRLTGHPNIMSVLQIGTTDSGSPYLVMPYFPEGSLSIRIRRKGPLSLQEALRVGVKMSGGLETAHRLGIIHRDVKPANILLTDYGEPVLADFGIAHIADGFRTAPGTVAGSPAFAAPEVLIGSPPTPAVDVYGLGATLFTALTGHVAFERHSDEQVVAQFLRITTQPLPDPAEHGIGGDVAAVIERSMCHSPGDRPSAAEFGELLQQMQARNGLPTDEMLIQDNSDDEQNIGGPASPVPLVVGRHDVHNPPGAALVGGKRNLPLELTSFVGRRVELSEVRSLLGTSRLVTLTGIGGVGKTRLAIRVATNAKRAFADGMQLVELGKLRDGALLTDVVAAELGLRHQSERPLLERLVEFLAPKKLLLVLDNCEQVVDSAAQLVETLLRACPTLRILATSREPLSIRGEAVLRVPPLRVPDMDRGLPQDIYHSDAVDLFAVRAATALPGFEITESNATTVARICERLDGLPLAIELSAARLPAMSTEQLLQRLTDRYTLLTRGSRDAPSRQQTLRLCIDWSYGLCTPIEQQIWAQLSVFAHGFDLDAATQVCQCSERLDDLLDVLASLVDKSILIREESDVVVRFRILETLRDYGREKVGDPGAVRALRRRHQHWYQQLALNADAEWISSRQLDWIARLDREQPNLREALEFALTEDAESGSALPFATALQPFWYSRGQLGQARHWLDRALAVQQPTSETLRAKALCRACHLADGLEDRAAAASLVAQAWNLAEQTDNPHAHAFVELTAGLHDIYAGNFADAVATLERTHSTFAEHGDVFAQVRALLSLGWARLFQLDITGALECDEKALAINESHGESVNRSYALWATAVAARLANDQARALHLLQQGLELIRLRRDSLMAATCLEALAWLESDTGDSQRAAVLFGAAKAMSQTSGSSTVLYPKLLVYHDKCERNTIRALGRAAFESEYREGGSLDLDAAIAYALGEEPEVSKTTACPATELTKRERQVADLVAEGLTNREIADRLVISQRTAQGHVEHILTKLGFVRRAQIAAWVAAAATAKSP
ncbi:protein kinase [Rhodococcus sp. IEGM 1366]|uniref:protein kinase domain-containing protein n=1 Tax=Rhodococcus sp. IEGM 1366 TaxID=3082223 RepID=UPI00295577CB|nr:protein kinase [Rhodococcus sp. IEGM 1366]MDV8071046.1 protein kinase [Rhodococcus sp. IEGM 1366]